MNVLLLGVGMQGKAALYDLFHNPQVSKIVAADVNREAVTSHINAGNYGGKAVAAEADASSEENLRTLIANNIDVVIDLLPPAFAGRVARISVENKVPLVNTFYAVPEVMELAGEAEKKGVTILPEFGMDPGLDLVLLGKAVRSVEDVEEVISYGAGFPEPAAANNPIKYKITWSFEGVLNSYKRAGRIVRNGMLVNIPENEMFARENIHEINVDGLGKLEAFPNGDITKYIDLLGLDAANLKNMGRYVLRWPGHCKFWYTLVRLGLLDNGTVRVGETEVDRKKYLANALKDQIQYKDDERDIVLVRIEVVGKKDGKKVRSVYQIIDKRDPGTGLTAMTRTVGFTAAIGASMLGTGKLCKRGILSPVNDIPYELFKTELAKRRIEISETTMII
ncbi:MAG: saccharopine dehydrogenase C-terminal domain-containing protein [Victivallaceae bacterium]|nr:saccharopine dehydrogenase C-terminal domain-containing protein [Victivallaceae bacterium]